MGEGRGYLHVLCFPPTGLNFLSTLLVRLFKKKLFLLVELFLGMDKKNGKIFQEKESERKRLKQIAKEIDQYFNI